MTEYTVAGRIAAFSNDLDQHCFTHTSFFNIDFLLLFEKHFGYHDISLSIYSADYKFCGGVAINDAKPLQDYYKKNKVYEFDEFAKRITEQCISTDGIKPLILNSLETLPSDDAGNKYRDFLKKFGFAWTASMVFGHYRFSIHKKDEKIFSPEEVDFLEKIHSMLISRLMLFEQMSSQNSFLKHLQNFLDRSKTGYVILNENFQVLSYNETACGFLSDITGHNNMMNSLKTVLSMLGIGESAFSQTDSISKLYQDKLFTIKKHMERQDFDFYTKKYTLTIFRAGESTAVNEFSRELFKKKYSITEKEQNVIDMLSAGMTYAQTAEKLFISLNTVRSHVKNIYAKAGVNNLRGLLSLYKTIDT